MHLHYLQGGRSLQQNENRQGSSINNEIMIDRLMSCEAVTAKFLSPQNCKLSFCVFLYVFLLVLTDTDKFIMDGHWPALMSSLWLSCQNFCGITQYILLTCTMTNK